jgi:serine/threonine-protein kinase
VIGTRILHYEIQKKLGEGGMGVVYLASDTNLNRPSALKVLSLARVSDPESRHRFLHEARARAVLNHPNITNFYEAGECGDTIFIAMEYVEGASLSSYAGGHECRTREVLELAQQVAAGLAAAHAHGVIHRDIKPDNIMVLHDGRVKIMDFGLARWKGASTLTQRGTRLGSAFYMSPEQAEGAKVDHRTDIFALGVLLYELLTHHRPFEGENEAVVLYELMNSSPQPLARYCRDVPDELERIVFKCLAKDPDMRYPSAGDLAADLRSLE